MAATGRTTADLITRLGLLCGEASSHKKKSFISMAAKALKGSRLRRSRCLMSVAYAQNKHSPVILTSRPTLADTLTARWVHYPTPRDRPTIASS